MSNLANMWTNYDIGTSPYFSPQDSGDSTASLGSGVGADWFNFNTNPAFAGQDISSFYNPAVNSGDSSTDASVDPTALQQWLNNNNATFQTSSQNPGFELRRLFDTKNNQQIGDVVENRVSPTLTDHIAMTMASMFLSPFGGIAAGGAQGGLGGTLASGKTAAAINGAASGGFGSLSSGGSLGDVAKAAAMGGSGAYMPDIGGYLGVDNNYLRDGINSAIRGGVMAKLNGNDVGQNALMSALPAAGSYLADMISPMPDVGTIGGNMQDDFGESTVTMNEPTSTQYGANMQAMSADPTMALPTNETPTTQNTGGLLDQVSNIIGSISPQRFGDIAQGLAGLYLGNRQRRAARDIRRQISGNRGSYEQQLRQNLARRDAAAGRRSDYAGRETQLQAALAELDSRTAPILSQLGTMEAQGLSGMFNSGLVTGNRLGWWGQQPTAPSMPSSMPSLSSLGSTGPTASYSLVDNAERNRYRLGGG